MPLSSLHKGTIVSAPSPLLSKALRVTCLRVVLGRYQRRSLTFFAFVQAYVAKVIRYNSGGQCNAPCAHGLGSIVVRDECGMVKVRMDT